MRYPDRFRNALMGSHQMTARGEFWYNNAFVSGFTIVQGSVSADRAGSIRRTAQIVLDPNIAVIPAVQDILNPYGTYVKLFRGIRFPNGFTEEYQVFHGRIDQVERSLQSLTIRCSDRAADIIDARFEKDTYAGEYGTIGVMKVWECAKALILEVLPTAEVAVEITDTELEKLKVTSDTSWQRERSDAMDGLCTQIGCEWFATMYGSFKIKTLPAIVTSATPVVWIIDTGDTGVMLNRTNIDDRVNVYNHVIVLSEPFNGREPARGEDWDNDDPSSPTYYGGPFGKVTGFYAGQQVDTTANANKLATQLLQQAISAVKSISVECVANPQLQLADVVRVFDPRNGIDGMFYVQSFELPLDPESKMTMTLYSARQKLPTGRYGPMRTQTPRGASWQPTPSTLSTPSPTSFPASPANGRQLSGLAKSPR